MELGHDLDIRVATPDDIDGIMRLAISACEENAFVPTSPERLLGEIWPALHLDRGLVGLIGSDKENPEGIVLLKIGKMWYSNQDVLEEKAIFIHPEYRSAKGGRAARLCEFSKRVADKLGIPLIIGVLSNSRTEAKVKMYQRQFGNSAGAFFLYNAHTGMKNSEKSISAVAE